MCSLWVSAVLFCVCVASEIGYRRGDRYKHALSLSLVSGSSSPPPPPPPRISETESKQAMEKSPLARIRQRSNSLLDLSMPLRNGGSILEARKEEKTRPPRTLHEMSSSSDSPRSEKMNVSSFSSPLAASLSSPSVQIKVTQSESELNRSPSFASIRSDDKQTSKLELSPSASILEKTLSKIKDRIAKEEEEDQFLARVEKDTSETLLREEEIENRMVGRMKRLERPSTSLSTSTLYDLQTMREFRAAVHEEKRISMNDLSMKHKIPSLYSLAVQNDPILDHYSSVKSYLKKQKLVDRDQLNAWMDEWKSTVADILVREPVEIANFLESFSNLHVEDPQGPKSLPKSPPQGSSVSGYPGEYHRSESARSSSWQRDTTRSSFLSNAHSFIVRHKAAPIPAVHDPSTYAERVGVKLFDPFARSSRRSTLQTTKDIKNSFTLTSSNTPGRSANQQFNTKKRGNRKTLNFLQPKKSLDRLQRIRSQVQIALAEEESQRLRYLDKKTHDIEIESKIKLGDQNSDSDDGSLSTISDNAPIVEKISLGRRNRRSGSVISRTNESQTSQETSDSSSRSSSVSCSKPGVPTLKSGKGKVLTVRRNSILSEGGGLEAARLARDRVRRMSVLVANEGSHHSAKIPTAVGRFHESRPQRSLSDASG